MYDGVFQFQGPRAKWYGLNNGRWGVLGPSEQVQPGNEVEVQHRNGKLSTVVVERVIWENGRIALGAVATRE
ncbi:MAG: hypothetical protein M1144_01995 [Candidatus Thermoplasmatota archaeon]|nr:hypothetical protein [Candidatus Thermoplasmatota archaeon]MCL5984056.1 hypothetical protein [Candidatus Thermoplasmatota archaeon]